MKIRILRNDCFLHKYYTFNLKTQKVHHKITKKLTKFSIKTEDANTELNAHISVINMSKSDNSNCFKLLELISEAFMMNVSITNADDKHK